MGYLIVQVTGGRRKGICGKGAVIVGEVHEEVSRIFIADGVKVCHPNQVSVWIDNCCNIAPGLVSA